MEWRGGPPVKPDGIDYGHRGEELEPNSKRPRYDGGEPQAYGNGNGYQARPEPSGFPDRTNPPSPVVHVRNVPEVASEADVVDAGSKIGAVRCVVMLPKKRQALMEFNELNDAIHLVKTQTLRICGMEAVVNFSTSQKIHRPSTDGAEVKTNNILLMTVLNPRYPIDVDVIHKISHQHGAVLRIVIFRKHGVQAMVEFDTVDSALRAKSFLNGADIYSGCCTLKIEFAKPTVLNVYRNDKDSWDYQRETGVDANRPPPLLEKPADVQPSGGHPDPYAPRDYHGGGYEQRPVYEDRPPYEVQRPAYDGHSRPYDRRSPPPSVSAYAPPVDTRDRAREYDRPPHRDAPQYDAYGSRYEREPYPPPSSHRDERYGERRYEDSRSGAPSSTASSYEAGVNQAGQQGSVAMIYGINSDKINCDRLFNLFCLYGNVIRIKFLKSKEGSVMIQMGDPMSMRRAIDNLNHMTIFEKKIQVTESRQAFLNDVPNPFLLSDGTPSFKDFMGSRNNRFTNAEMACKNRITPPTRCLHFFNAPAGASEDEIEEVFTRHNCTKPLVTIMHGKSERSTSGFVEWETLEGAVEALMFANHTEMPNKSKKGGHPYLFKVCFTQPSRPGIPGAPPAAPRRP